MCLAIPCRVVEIMGDDPLTCTARVAFGSVIKEISLALLPEAAVDDHVLVHAGFAIARLDENAAQRMEAELDRLVHSECPEEVEPEFNQSVPEVVRRSRESI